MTQDPAGSAAALATLQARFGARLAGPRQPGQVTLRRAVEDALGVDEAAADRLVKQLYETGRLRYVGADDAMPAEPTGAVDIPAALTPSGQERVISSGTTAGVEATLGGIGTVSGSIGGSLPAVDAGYIGLRAAYRDAAGADSGTPAEGTAPADASPGYWQIG